MPLSAAVFDRLQKFPPKPAPVAPQQQVVAPPAPPPAQIQRYVPPPPMQPVMPVGAGDGITALRDFSTVEAGPVSMGLAPPVIDPGAPQAVAMEPLSLPVSPERGGMTSTPSGFAPELDALATNNMDPTPDKNRGFFGRLGRGLEAIAPLISGGIQGMGAGATAPNAAAAAAGGFNQAAFVTPAEIMRMQQQQEKHEKDLEKADVDIEKGRQGIGTEKARTAQIQTQTGLMTPQFEESQLTAQARRKAMEIDGRYREQLMRMKDQEIENFRNLAPYQLEQAKARLAYERARAESLKETDPLVRRKLEAEIARLEQSGELDAQRLDIQRGNMQAYQTSADASMLRAQQGPSQGDPLKTALAFMQARDRALASLQGNYNLTPEQVATEEARIKAQYDPIVQQYMQGGAAPGAQVSPEATQLGDAYLRSIGVK